MKQVIHITNEAKSTGAEPKGVLTIVFDRESAKRQWFLDRGIDDPPNVMHVYDFEKIVYKLS